MNRRNKISEPPEKVKEILAIVYLLPPNLNLPTFFDLHEMLLTTNADKRFSHYREDFGFGDDAEIHVFLDDIVGEDVSERAKREAEAIDSFQDSGKFTLSLPDQFFDYLDFPKSPVRSHFEKFKKASNQPDASFETFKEMAISSREFMDIVFILEGAGANQRYEEARNYYTRLYNLISYFEQSKKEKKGGLLHYQDKSELFAIKGVKIKDNKVFFLPDKFTEAFNGVDMNRLKLCGNCGRVFWLKRFDMKGCSIPCAKILRTRKWREKTSEEQRTRYKVNRLKKELKTQRKQKDGTL